MCLDFGESFFRKGNSYQVYWVVLNSKRLALSQELIGLRHGQWVEKNIFFNFLSKWMETRCVGKIFLCASVSKCKLYNKRSTEVSLRHAAVSVELVCHLPRVQHWLALRLLILLTARSHWKFWSSWAGSHLVCISFEPWEAPFVSIHKSDQVFY